MEKLIAVVIYIFLGLGHCIAQQLKPLYIAKNVEKVTVDNLNNLYLTSPEGQIKKLNYKYDSVGLFNNVRQLGGITSIDATNPLKVLVFYKNFSTILVLDRFMNVKSTIDLRKLNIFQASAIALSFDNFIWVFDEINNKLKKIDDTGKVIFESTDFRLVFNNLSSIDKIIDSNGKLYLYNKYQGLLLFDYYGAYKKKLSFLQYTNVFIKGDDCMGIKDSCIETNNLNNFTFTTKKYTILKEATHCFIHNKQLFFIVNQTLYSTNF